MSRCLNGSSRYISFSRSLSMKLLMTLEDSWTKKKKKRIVIFRRSLFAFFVDIFCLDVQKYIPSRLYLWWLSRIMSQLKMCFLSLSLELIDVTEWLIWCKTSLNDELTFSFLCCIRRLLFLLALFSLSKGFSWINHLLYPNWFLFVHS